MAKAIPSSKTTKIYIFTKQRLYMPKKAFLKSIPEFKAWLKLPKWG